MGRRIRRLALAAAGVWALAGCHQPAVQQKQPPDPLLISKKPIEGRPHGDNRDGDVTVRAPAPPAPLASGEFVQQPTGTAKAVSSLPPDR
jgi:hypothetical protein